MGKRLCQTGYLFLSVCYSYWNNNIISRKKGLTNVEIFMGRIYAGTIPCIS